MDGDGLSSAWMIISLDESQIRTIEQVQTVLDGTRALDFTAAENRHERYEWMATVLVQLFLDK